MYPRHLCATCTTTIKGVKFVGTLRVITRPRKIDVKFFYRRIAPYHIWAVIWATRGLRLVKSEANDLLQANAIAS